MRGRPITSGQAGNHPIADAWDPVAMVRPDKAQIQANQYRTADTAISESARTVGSLREYAGFLRPTTQANKSPVGVVCLQRDVSLGILGGISAPKTT